MIINTNIALLTAREASIRINKRLGDTLEKLSTGHNINKASDDASGMAMADKLRTQASSVRQGIKNANSANAFIQIADKAMDEQSNILDIIKTKLMQATTSTTSVKGREAILNDIKSLLTQLNAISTNTNYNGTTLLDGNDFDFQIGELATDKVTISTSFASKTTSLGRVDKHLDAALVQTTAAGTAGADAAQVDTVTFSEVAGATTWKAGDIAKVNIKDATGTTYSYSYKVTQADVDADGVTAVEEAVSAAMALLINADTATHDITAAATAADMTLTAGTDNVAYQNEASVTSRSLDKLLKLDSNDFTSDFAIDYLTVIDGALDDLNTLRSEFGSSQNRVESALRNMMTTHTNLKGAESVIRDVDYAESSSNFNKLNIIAQAGMYAISQANSVQNNVLRLLQ
jgi:flagellin